MKLNSIIVDDCEIDRLTVLSYAKKFPILNVIGVYSCAEHALKAIRENVIDVLFLDIDLPDLSGVELRKSAQEVPVCIFITSHSEFAVESFELDTLDFIVKPIKFDRFENAVKRVEEFMEIKLKANLFESSLGSDVIYIKEGHEQTKVKLHDIFYIEALGDYSLIITSQKRHCVLSSIGNLLKEVDFQSFVRIHRSFAVQRQFVQKINMHEIILNNEAVIPVGRSFKDNLNLLI
ncbi:MULTISPECIES: LytTR family DNA-binding domain-containing protein [Chryseobacterium]|uniref:Sensory transduction protein LytR n=1 Tax=Chryseobacterium salivictor TaxID=2547600 RepID=A0A4P6ZGL2_9FLAO|nr:MULTISPECIES: LytTR family DNA-binding domain-containing protein [Chryseobacterium]MDQ0477665.1 two-component system LytT family response regulator [Chryseobacterium sp. MDT2-18]QBO58850.1 Sensory transduction protein LytR [Chryseobacterium salivictor]